ncbi:serine/threonine protein kinase [Streptomyces sparsogenes DSM 40356]|uniref:non-specific serine/threonine protein kinase n=1 Tax=Streptomyces sparsogenes DSM 40356 TaxID=1331668 RepID=A0A1R1SPN7_9ACTN|nr:serine/threonine-protein kinase [Streptomyces sparsogenes]OMI40255.1 serine/threonine protein kinase [Streptomyces sparsogenes DSM 40356]
MGEVVGGRYELTESIGKGGMAQVWRARDLVISRDVAVKFLRSDFVNLQQLDTRERLAEHDVLRARFRREATLLRRLDHHGIPELYDQGSHQGMPYLVMRLVTGVTLHKFLAQYAPLPLTVAVAVAVQVADAMACAHTLPVVHRDLKPQNVMISDEGVIALLDFGIAKPLGIDVTQYTRHGSTLGSRGYQAPEQILEKEPTTRTDIYSFGCVCYELFAGRPPFVMDETRGLVEQHLKVDPLPPGLYAAGVPEELDDLMLRMLAKDPEQRPTVDEVLDVLSPLGPHPGDPEPQPRLRPDPTAPLRQPRDSPVERQSQAPAFPTAPDPYTDADGEWLNAHALEVLCAAAEREIHEGDPDDAVRHLAGLADRARAEWGSRRPLVRRIWELAAEGLRLAGDCGGAARFYQGIADDLIRGDGPQERADRAVLRLRVAECRLAFGEIEAAIGVVEVAGHVAAGLPMSLASQVEKVRREVDTDIAERLADPGAAQG